MGKSTISMAIFNSYVSLPEGINVSEMNIKWPAMTWGSRNTSWFWPIAGGSLANVDAQWGHIMGNPDHGAMGNERLPQNSGPKMFLGRLTSFLVQSPIPSYSPIQLESKRWLLFHNFSLMSVMFQEKPWLFHTSTTVPGRSRGPPSAPPSCQMPEPQKKDIRAKKYVDWLRLSDVMVICADLCWFMLIYADLCWFMLICGEFN